ncbi:MAG TPA: sigma-70 family RNA polymerase sigma factor [Streptosporangiaceae bacterium]|jgi:RNA polymerase sigma factor (sigma-70 family)
MAHADVLTDVGKASSADVGEAGSGVRRERCGQTLAELLYRAAEKDWAAWDELVKRFGHLVLHTASSIGLKRSEAADAAQLTWLRLLEHIGEIREPEHLPGWLAVTARREAIRIALSAKRYILCAEPDLDYGRRRSSAVTDVYPIEGDYSPDVEAALSGLPARYEKLLRLLMCDNCPSYTEVAERMNIPIGSIGPMRMRALQILRRSLECPELEFAEGKPAVMGRVAAVA